MLFPTASNAPARKDTHPAARNVPGRVGGGPGIGGQARSVGVALVQDVAGYVDSWGAAAFGEEAEVGPCCAHLARAVNDE